MLHQKIKLGLSRKTSTAWNATPSDLSWEPGEALASIEKKIVITYIRTKNEYSLTTHIPSTLPKENRSAARTRACVSLWLLRNNDE